VKLNPRIDKEQPTALAIPRAKPEGRIFTLCKPKVSNSLEKKNRVKVKCFNAVFRKPTMLTTNPS